MAEKKNDSGGVRMQPPNPVEFVSIENQQYLTSLVNCHDEFAALGNLHALYEPVLTEQEVSPNNAVLFQLLILIHYHLLFSSSCFMRCHMSEAFNSARVALDAALIAAQIIHDRPSQVAYMNRTKPYDKLNRHFKNMVRDGKVLPNKYIPYILQQHDFCSQFASHADVQTFAHRLEFIKDRSLAVVGYFQFPQDMSTFKHHFLGVLHMFVVTLDVFADFLVDELKRMPEQWRTELRQFGAKIEHRQEQIMPRSKREAEAE